MRIHEKFRMQSGARGHCTDEKHMTPPAANVIRCLRTAFGSTEGGPSDAALVQRFSESCDQEAFELLVWRHAGMVLRVCRSRLHDHHAAEDASQAVFLALAKQAGSVSQRGTVAGWLYRVAWRISARAARRRSPEPQSDFEQLPARESEPARDPALVQLLNDEIARLPEKYRVPLLLCFFEGLSHTDAAQRLGWPVGTLASRIARGKSLVHRRLTRRGIAMPSAGLGVLLVADSAPAFVSSTVQAAVAFLSGKGKAAVSPTVLHLAQGVIQSMTLMKMKWAAVVVSTIGALSIGLAWAAGTIDSQPPADTTETVAEAPLAAPPAPGAAAAKDNAEPPPALRNASSAQRQRSLNNLKQLMLAMHNYEAVSGHLPADIRDKDGKAILSWRVAILPFIEQENLYKQFRLDQPWDSEHNLKLLAQMPPVLRVGFEPKDSTHTYYQVFAGPGTPFGPSRFPAGEGGGGGSGILGSAGGGNPQAPAEPVKGPAGPSTPVKGTRIMQIADGTSNTLGVVEAGPAVPWTKPVDIAYEPKTLPKLEGPFANALHAAMLDGSAVALSRTLDAKVLHNLIGMDDGNVTPNLKSLYARRPAETPQEKAALKTLIDRNQKLIDESEGLMKEYFHLMRKKNGSAEDFTQVEEQAELLRQMIEGLKGMNRNLEGRPTPKSESSTGPRK